MDVVVDEPPDDVDRGVQPAAHVERQRDGADRARAVRHHGRRAGRGRRRDPGVGAAVGGDVGGGVAARAAGRRAEGGRVVFVHDAVGEDGEDPADLQAVRVVGPDSGSRLGYAARFHQAIERAVVRNSRAIELRLSPGWTT